MKYLFFLGFLGISFLQIFPAYHIFTCYWCYIEECSEFFLYRRAFNILLFLFFLEECLFYY